MVEWKRQEVTAGLAPWVATMEGGDLELFVQPWYGDGLNYKGIIQTSDWTVTLKERFKTLEKAQQALLVWCWKYLKHIYQQDPTQ
jgi:hypothetical protein